MSLVQVGGSGLAFLTSPHHIHGHSPVCSPGTGWSCSSGVSVGAGDAPESCQDGLQPLGSALASWHRLSKLLSLVPPQGSSPESRLSVLSGSHTLPWPGLRRCSLALPAPPPSTPGELQSQRAEEASTDHRAAASSTEKALGWLHI